MSDEPKQLKLGWTCQEYIGTEVWKVDAPDKRLINKADLKTGDEIISSGLLGEDLKILVKDDNGQLYGECGHFHIVLSFDEDDRHCWVNGGMINKKGIRKLTDGLIIGE